MITAIFLGFLGLFLGMAGLRCINIGSMELSRKARLAAVAGALHILAGNWGKVVVGVPCVVVGGGGVESGASGPGVPCRLQLPTPAGVSPSPLNGHPPSLLSSSLPPRSPQPHSCSPNQSISNVS